MMALAGVELETLVSEPDALTTRPCNLSAKNEVAEPHISFCLKKKRKKAADSTISDVA